MKLAKVMITGILIWAMSLIWPQVNQWLGYSTMLWGVIGLGGLTVGYLFAYWHRAPKNGSNFSPPRNLRHDLSETGPFKPIGIG